MMEEQGHQPVEQAGLPGKAAEVGTEVGGVRSSKDEGGVDLLAISPEGRALLKALSRDSARSHASQRGKGEGDGSGQTEIITPDKIRCSVPRFFRELFPDDFEVNWEATPRCSVAALAC